MAENELAMQNFGSWHELFEAICIQQGYLDNLSLAEKLCGAVGNETQDAFETMQRNLQNWRNGTHTPQRRNFLLLTKLLEVDTDRKLSRAWNGLYQEARKSAGRSSDQGLSVEKPTRVQKLQLMLFGSMTCTVILAGVVAYLLLLPPSEDPGYTNIVYLKKVDMEVGETQIIHGRRGACGSMPPRWEEIEDELPELKTGSWTDGGIGIRNSRSCGGPTPARALMFTATAVGHSSFNLYGDPITIDVQ